MQLEELLAIRHCVFIMGQPGAGKSSCWKTLATARGIQGKNTKVVDLDPKVFAPDELYGYIHPTLREWKDGLFSKVMRELSSEPGDDSRWIVCF